MQKEVGEGKLQFNLEKTDSIKTLEAASTQVSKQ